MANFDSQDQINGSGRRCLRCSSASVRVLREFRVAGGNQFVDTRCLSCGEQSVLRMSTGPEPSDAAACDDDATAA